MARFDVLRPVLAAWLIALPVAVAAQSADRSSIGAQYGVDSDFSRYTLNYETAPWWSRATSLGRFALQGEFGVSYWHARHRGEDARRSAWQASAIPMFRWWLTDRFYLEAGIGLTLFNHTRLGEHELSTALQFGDHLGLGYQITENWRLGLRVSHFSNAGIKRPNRGLNAYQLGVSWQW
ncbi:MAG: acyloxyacyl hydrolase [Pigmentiphaga sp.]|nr:acyloxyacyl hydrolase [Pigmentiphaga sp.]